MVVFMDQRFSFETTLLLRDNVNIFPFSSAVGPLTSFPVADVALWVPG